MTIEEYWMFVEAMERMEAKDRLMAMQAASFPNIEKRDRSRILNNLERIADPETHKMRALTHEDMARLLNG